MKYKIIPAMITVRTIWGTISFTSSTNCKERTVTKKKKKTYHNKFRSSTFINSKYRDRRCTLNQKNGNIRWRCLMLMIKVDRKVDYQNSFLSTFLKLVSLILYRIAHLSNSLQGFYVFYLDLSDPFITSVYS